SVETQDPSVKVIEDVCVIATNAEGVEGIVAPVVVEKPASGFYTLIVAPGEKYFFDFRESDVESFVETDGDLTATFKDGTAIILEDCPIAAQREPPATFAFSDAVSRGELPDRIQVVDTTPDEDMLEEPQAELREDNAQEQAEAEQAAQVEPASGD